MGGRQSVGDNDSLLLLIPHIDATTIGPRLLPANVDTENSKQPNHGKSNHEVIAEFRLLDGYSKISSSTATGTFKVWMDEGTIAARLKARSQLNSLPSHQE